MNEMENTDILEERYALARERVREIAGESLGDGGFADYFQKTAAFLLMLTREKDFLERGGLSSETAETLWERNHVLYADVEGERYASSYANPDFAVEKLGGEFGRMLSFLYCEMRSIIPFLFEERMDEILIRLELFLEIYAAFDYAAAEQTLPKAEDIRETIYWYVSDYAETAAQTHLREMLVPDGNFAVDIIRNADLSDERYLYRYGEYITENELETARFLAGLPQEKINRMADTYTEGYRIGFEVGNKDLSAKRTVEIRYRLGFERMMRRAVENFEKMGLRCTCYRAATSILYHPSIFKTGYYGGEVNRQCAFDHKDDRALFFDKTYMNHRLEVLRTAFEQYKKEASEYAGPAVVETFGEASFEPVNKETAFRMSDEQNALSVEYRSQAGALQRKYILEEERSYTIIAFPVPEIADSFPAEAVGAIGGGDKRACFRSFFEDVIRINTLDYQKYQKIQQCLIDTLDQADTCEIKGMNGNATDLTVNLWKLQNPERETIFENCVADVNIPVGEVFTSPVLKGTNGVLAVSRVYLNGLEYRDLRIVFEDGKIADYGCSNFAEPGENRRFVHENVLFRQKTLPMGEFAIGTNTTAYVVARKYGVPDKLPILIAEKTGPHFAVGDTCYSHAEDIRIYNPDGKEIVAKENELAALRDKAPEKAYFNCHTDITIPYDELGELTAVKADGERTAIIRDGRFVLPGTEELNEVFL